MRYCLAEVELTQPAPSINLQQDTRGIGILVRLHDRPVAFFLLKTSGLLTSDRLSQLVRENAGVEITAELLRRELVPAVPDEAFPSLTVAICTRNKPDLVKRAIHSLVGAARLAGARAGFEILIVDNAPSNDRTRAVADLLGVRYVCEAKPGLDFARNRAICEAKGELLAFVDDDAVVDRGWLRGLRKAWAENPDAAAFTGPVIAYELETSAQVLFESRGGFGHLFQPKRFGPECKDIRNYPCNAGVFGVGCNMAFQRRVLLQLDGFDDALDTGAPLPGGGDLDILYRVLRAGFTLVQEPQLLIRHQHRREHWQLRHQMYTWGLGMMAYAVKNYRCDVMYRAQFRCMILGWFREMARMLVTTVLRKRDWHIDLAWAELRGGIVGLCGEYGRSKHRIEEIRKRFA
jgi:glycosyltransferase involved in cell wall biosynthesis